MISATLEVFVNDVMERGEMSFSDLRSLQRDVLRDGFASRDEVDVLVALDRVVLQKPAAWAAVLQRMVVDFVVWQSRPTGIVDRETARWLTTSLSCGTGPTDLAVATAFEVVREAEQADEILIAFVLRSARGRFKVSDMADLGRDEIDLALDEAA